MSPVSASVAATGAPTLTTPVVVSGMARSARSPSVKAGARLEAVVVLSVTATATSPVTLS